MAKIKDRRDPGSRLKPRNTQTPADDSDEKPPVFSFEYLQQGWCIQDCEQDERSRMLDKLRRLSRLPWKQIRQQPRHGLGTETIALNSIKAPLPSFITEDVTLLAFRVIDRAPMVGYRNGRIFYVIWVDRKYALYNHG